MIIATLPFKITVDLSACLGWFPDLKDLDPDDEGHLAFMRECLEMYGAKYDTEELT